MERIYLDNASTTRIDPRVLEAMMPFLSSSYGNASSTHAFGKVAKVMLEDARDLIAESIGASPSEIFFTSGGTESNNMAIKGIAFNNPSVSRRHIVSSLAEHSAVLDSLKYLKSRFGFEVTFIKPAEGGSISSDDVKREIREDTFLAAFMHSNNETGAVTDISAISSICREHNVLLHCDTVQSFGKTELNVRSLGSDTAVLSAHKIYGPKGISALYVKKGTSVDKFIHGGMQERDMRGGTENTAAIAGFSKAVEIVNKEYQSDIEHYRRLRALTIGMLNERFGNAVNINSPSDQARCLPNIINISFDRKQASYDEEMLLIMLDLEGISVSGGSACTSGTNKPSHVLLAMDKDHAEALGAVRISFGRDNKEEDVAALVNALAGIVKI